MLDFETHISSDPLQLQKYIIVDNSTGLRYVNLSILFNSPDLPKLELTKQTKRAISHPVETIKRILKDFIDPLFNADSLILSEKTLTLFSCMHYLRIDAFFQIVISATRDHMLWNDARRQWITHWYGDSLPYICNPSAATFRYNKKPFASTLPLPNLLNPLTISTTLPIQQLPRPSPITPRNILPSPIQQPRPSPITPGPIQQPSPITPRNIRPSPIQQPRPSPITPGPIQQPSLITPGPIQQPRRLDADSFVIPMPPVASRSNRRARAVHPSFGPIRLGRRNRPAHFEWGYDPMSAKLLRFVKLVGGEGLFWKTVLQAIRSNTLTFKNLLQSLGQLDAQKGSRTHGKKLLLRLAETVCNYMSNNSSSLDRHPDLVFTLEVISGSALTMLSTIKREYGLLMGILLPAQKKIKRQKDILGIRFIEKFKCQPVPYGLRLSLRELVSFLYILYMALFCIFYCLPLIFRVWDDMALFCVFYCCR